MIGYLKGHIISNQRNPLILMTGNVGYLVRVVPRILSELKPQDEIKLFIFTSVRDDAIDLYGFQTQEELDLFTLLLGVSGIGPKTALSVVDHGVTAVEKAVSSSDVDFFQTIPRLGKKNAQKIIIELKSKLGSIKELDLTEITTGETQEVMEALIAMGFAKAEIVQGFQKINPGITGIEAKIRHLLKILGKSGI
jgi:Holliday junction DNA helicase RuvA